VLRERIGHVPLLDGGVGGIVGLSATPSMRIDPKLAGACCMGVMGVLTSLVFSSEATSADPSGTFSAPQRNYLLGCGGCHGPAGVSNSKLVPQLQGLVGYYLYLPEGRDYLPRLPNVALSTLNDRELAEVLNYMVFSIGAGSAPAAAKPYRTSEVGKLRKRPLTEVNLTEYRRQLVDTLIKGYRAPSALRDYGEDTY
jgi:mono/diheme cytochrome c family protein